MGKYYQDRNPEARFPLSGLKGIIKVSTIMQFIMMIRVIRNVNLSPKSPKGDSRWPN